MIRILVSATLIITLLSSASYVAANSEKDEKCLKTRAKIEKIHSKMRQKYTNKQAVKYRKQLDKLYKDEFKYCF